MTALITGATGLVGGRLAEMLLAEGETVRVLVRPPVERAAHLAQQGATLISGDITEPETLAAACEGVQQVYHCAAYVEDWGAWDIFRQVNIQGTVNMLQASTGVAHFIHVSSVAVYGYPDRPMLSETDPYQPRGLPYIDTKIEAEQQVQAALADRPITIVRPANIYGPGSIFVTRLIEFLRQGYMPFVNGGRTNAGLVYVDNVAQALMLIARQPGISVGQTYNVCDGLDINWRQYADRLAAMLNVRYRSLSFPHVMAYPTAGLLEQAHRTLGLKARPWVTRNGVEITSKGHDFSIAKIQRELGFQPHVTFDEGMARVEDWLRRTET